MIKVLYVIPGLGGTGGAERSLAAMVPFWQNTIDLHIVTLSDRAHLAIEIASAGVRLTQLSGGFWSQVKQLRVLVKEESPDVVHTTLFDADVVARLATIGTKVPLSCSLVSVNYGREQLRSPSVRKLRLRGAQLVDLLTARRVRAFHALTNHVARTMAARLLIDAEKISVIPRGRDPERLGVRTAERRLRVRESLGVQNQPLVLVAGRHEYAKGVDVVVSAFPRVLESLPDAILLIAGGVGGETNELNRFVHESGIGDSVRFIGARDDVPDLMVAADVFCVPSRWEGFASIMSEAMGVKAVTLAAAIPTLKEVGGSPPWCAFADSDAPGQWAQEIVALLGTDGLSESADRAELGYHRFLSEYTAEIVSKRMEQFFRSVASKSTDR